MGHINNQLNDLSATPARVVLGTQKTFSASMTDLTPASGATDIFSLVGSATKTVYVTKIEIVADASAGGVVDFYITKRTTANTGGTATALAAAQHDSNNGSATAVAKKYTANPSALGAGVVVRGLHYATPAALTTVYSSEPYVADFGAGKGQPIVLRGVGESLTVDMQGGWTGTPSGLSVYVNCEWIEI